MRCRIRSARCTASGELLPRTPLRFLLADDPGSGKTIMASLYIKELALPTGEALQRRLDELLGRDLGAVRPEITKADVDDLTADERELAEEGVVDAASAARTLEELDLEMATTSARGSRMGTWCS